MPASARMSGDTNTGEAVPTRRDDHRRLGRSTPSILKPSDYPVGPREQKPYGRILYTPDRSRNLGRPSGRLGSPHTRTPTASHRPGAKRGRECVPVPSLRPIGVEPAGRSLGLSKRSPEWDAFLVCSTLLARLRMRTGTRPFRKTTVSSASAPPLRRPRKRVDTLRSRK